MTGIRYHRVQDHHRFFIIADDDKEIAAANVIRRFGALFITDLWVDPHHQRQGLGSQIMQRIIDTYEYTPEVLCVLASPFGNVPMNEYMLVSWYERFGFELINPVGLMRRLPSAKEDTHAERPTNGE